MTEKIEDKENADRYTNGILVDHTFVRAKMYPGITLVLG